MMVCENARVWCSRLQFSSLRLVTSLKTSLPLFLVSEGTGESKDAFLDWWRNLKNEKVLLTKVIPDYKTKKFIEGEVGRKSVQNITIFKQLFTERSPNDANSVWALIIFLKMKWHQILVESCLFQTASNRTSICLVSKSTRREHSGTLHDYLWVWF